MSSHREAPEISKDPVADSTDLYAFVSPDKPDTVTIIANYIPLEDPAGGPNFFRFGDDVLYEIHISNSGDAKSDITYQFTFTTQITNPNTFLYNTGPISSLTDKNWNMRQSYSVTKVLRDGSSTVIGSNIPCPPCNIGPRSTPKYDALAQAAVVALPSGETVFAGQRADGFFVDLGSIFDLGDLRPLQSLHLIPTPAAASANSLHNFNVHSIAIQIPKLALTPDGSMPTDPASPKSVIGVWTSASRQKAQVGSTAAGPFMQVSRLGNPLINEVVVPMSKKDLWNTLPPDQDGQFADAGLHPELAALLPILYPGAFPNLKALTAPRQDLAAILFTGIPSGVVPNFQNFTGKTIADMLRLNMAIPPSANPNNLGLVAGDPAGFPNGRRVQDDVVTVELRAVAGLTYPLIDKTFTPDAAASKVGTGLDGTDNNFLPSFPYLGVPYDGYGTGALGRL
ncbi:MAG TPA: DUF4331 domain-containing protein [Chloroflexota bacterium]|nr:DUF4331 domain-containing protein [Chloroflexota bacterium]